MTWNDPIDDMNAYAEAIASGKIRSCESIMGAIERHYRDLEDAKNEDFPYYFVRTSLAS